MLQVGGKIRKTILKQAKSAANGHFCRRWQFKIEKVTIIGRHKEQTKATALTGGRLFRGC